MNSAMKTALLNSKLNYSVYVRSVLFHSTTVLDRKRRNNYWESPVSLSLCIHLRLYISGSLSILFKASDIC